MASPSDYYVDPVGGSDSTGAGTSGNPWQTMQHALNTITRNTTNGDRINLKSSGPDVLTGTLSFVTYGSPTKSAPLLFEGYTSSAGDSGVGIIDGNASFSPLDSSGISFHFSKNIHYKNAGARHVCNLGGSCGMDSCEVEGCTGAGHHAVNAGGASTSINNCYIHNFQSHGIDMGGAGNIARGNYIDGTDSGGSPTWGILFNANGGSAIRNIIKLTGSTIGIDSAAAGLCDSIERNIIYGVSAPTGTGIRCEAAFHSVKNNYIEGMSGAGGKGVLIDSGCTIIHYGSNYFFNNATNETFTGTVMQNDGTAGTSLGASGLNNPSGGDFSPKASLQALAVPASFFGTSTNTFLDVGAAQHQDAGGGNTIAWFAAVRT